MVVQCSNANQFSFWNSVNFEEFISKWFVSFDINVYALNIILWESINVKSSTIWNNSPRVIFCNNYLIIIDLYNFFYVISHPIAWKIYFVCQKRIQTRIWKVNWRTKKSSKSWIQFWKLCERTKQLNKSKSISKS